MEAEALKDTIRPFNCKQLQNADFKLSASCTNTNVKDGHLESVFIKLAENPSLKEIEAAIANFSREPKSSIWPSEANCVRHEKNRPSHVLTEIQAAA